jgi:ribose transport system ATP-binding protein
MVRALFGADKKSSGKIYFENKLINILNTKDAVKLGIGLVPENRKEQGVILPMTIRKNVTLTKLDEIVRKFGIIKNKKEKDIALNLMKYLNIKAANSDIDVMNLSGGNQQKVVLAKWFNANCKVIILDEPTRGVDVGAKYEIYTIINELSKKGIGVILISSEMIEIIGMCDRTIVMHEGRMCGELNRNDLSEEKIMKLAIND